MNIETVKKILVKRGVKNMRDYGYKFANATNITKDAILREFFAAMLRENLGKDADIDPAINELLAEIKKSEAL